MRPQILGALILMGLGSGLLISDAEARPLVSQVAIDRCVDLPGGNTANGVQLVTWSCHGAWNQQFQFSGSGEIRIAGKCVDAAGGQGRQGDRVVLWPCHGGANQRWTLDIQGQIKGINGLCLDIEGGSAAAGSKLIIWRCNNGNNQRWSLGLDPGTPVVARKLYAIDGTNSAARYKNALFHFWDGFNGEKIWIDGVDLLASNIDANYQRMYTAVCQDVRPVAQGGLGVREVYLAGYSRGAIMAVRLANESRRNCSANVVFVGLVDAVNTVNWNWPARVNLGPSQIVHIRKTIDENVVTTRDIENAFKVTHRDPAVTHKSIVCSDSSSRNDYSWRWTLEQLFFYAKAAGASFSNERLLMQLQTAC